MLAENVELQERSPFQGCDSCGRDDLAIEDYICDCCARNYKDLWQPKKSEIISDIKQVFHKHGIKTDQEIQLPF